MIEQAPYDTNGNLQHYPEPWRGIEWRPNEPFNATLQLDRQARGRSAAYFLWIDQATGCQYPMFMSTLAEVLKATTVDHGTVTGRWEVCKRGKNYGLRLADTQEATR